MSDVVIGVDVGSSGTCAQAIDASGALLASIDRSYDAAYTQPGLRTIRADVTGRPVSRCEDVETTARGAASILDRAPPPTQILAAVDAGLHASLPAACWSMASPAVDELQPDVSRHSLYAQAHVRYRALYAALKPLFA